MIQFEYKTKNDLENAFEDFKVLFAYHSNKIENDEINYNDTREIFENGKIAGYSGDLRTLFEIQNQKDCYNFLLDKLVNRNPITNELILNVHKELTKGTYDERRYEKGERPGEYKKGDYIVGKAEIGAPANEVIKEIDELLKEINNEDSSDYLTIAAYFHLKFESIHPFADGNGRVGRTLLNYYLIIHNIKPLIIYDEDKKLYYECLQAFDDKQDIEPLKKFIEYEQDKTWQKKKRSITKLISFL
ncbi:MAG: Fic family protein [Erysipelotrichaceae bacterium]|nr:Fic family protein [Erysipelotrichaceae bacterium]